MESIGQPKGAQPDAALDPVLRFSRFFIASAGCIFLLTGLAKLASIFGRAGILDIPDPIVGLSFRHLMLLASILELAIAAVCFRTTVRKSGELLSAGLIMWFALVVTGYRLCLLMIGYVRPCHCMGNVLDAIHVAPATVNSIMRFLLGYFLIGGCTTLLLLWSSDGQGRESDQT